jgi:hypothetical protein
VSTAGDVLSPAVDKPARRDLRFLVDKVWVRTMNRFSRTARRVVMADRRAG